MPTTWFTGVCDTLLSRIQTWHDRYEQGQIYATRQYLTKQFAKIDVQVAVMLLTSGPRFPSFGGTASSQCRFQLQPMCRFRTFHIDSNRRYL